MGRKGSRQKHSGRQLAIIILEYVDNFVFRDSYQVILGPRSQLLNAKFTIRIVDFYHYHQISLEDHISCNANL